MAEQIFGRERQQRRRAWRRPCSRQCIVAGERREPHQILRDQAVRIGDRFVERRLRPHHQAFGVVGGEEIARRLRR